MSEDRVGSLHQSRNKRGKVFGVVLGIVCRWRYMLALAVPAEIEQHATMLEKFPRDGSPHAAVAAVAVQAQARDGTRRLWVRRGPDYLVGERRSSSSDPKFTGPVLFVHVLNSKIGAMARSVKRLSRQRLMRLRPEALQRK